MKRKVLCTVTCLMLLTSVASTQNMEAMEVVETQGQTPLEIRMETRMAEPVLMQMSYLAAKRDFVPAVEDAFITLLNHERAKKGLRALKSDIGLTGAARMRAMEMVENEYCAHTRPDGRIWYSILDDEFPVPFGLRGENIAQITRPMEMQEPVPAWKWYEKWMESPSHSEMMFREDFTAVGIGAFYSMEGTRYVSVATALFGGD